MALLERVEEAVRDCERGVTLLTEAKDRAEAAYGTVGPLLVRVMYGIATGEVRATELQPIELRLVELDARLGVLRDKMR